MKNLKVISKNELKDWADEIFKKNSFIFDTILTFL